MTLFTLLIIMAIERVTIKSKKFHITALANQYFNFIENFKPTNNRNKNVFLRCVFVILVAGIPASVFLLLALKLPPVLVFIINLAVLWVCLGCPVTRDTYRRYLQSANREDFEACSLYSEKLGIEDGELSRVGKQLVLVNYRQYASVIIFYVFFGVFGVVFYSVVKEWYLRCQKKSDVLKNNESLIENEPAEQENLIIDEVDQVSDPLAGQKFETSTKPIRTFKSILDVAQKILFVLDWIPVRITALGFLLVGNFSRGLPAWISVVFDIKKSAYQVLSKVAKASEEPEPTVKPVLQEPLQMVKLVKRNIIFLLVAISLMTMAGFIG